MKRILLFALTLLVALGASAQDGRRYGIKSGILELEVNADGHITAETQYFEDYGAHESTMFTMDIPGLMKYDSYTITKGKEAWGVSDDGTKRNSKAFDNPLWDFTLLNPSPEVVAKYKIEEVGSDTVLGRKCTIYTYETTQGRKAVYWKAWVYKGVTLKAITKRGRKESTIEAKSFRENVAIPAKAFALE